MPTKQRPSVATIVSKSGLEQASIRLKALPDKPREVWSLQETVALLQDQITGALNRGYTYDEIVKVLADQRIDITASSLKRYLATARRDRGDTGSRQSPKPRSLQASEKPTAAAPTDQTAAPPSTAPAKPTAAKIATKRQPAAAKAKTTPRSSSRSRKAAN